MTTRRTAMMAAGVTLVVTAAGCGTSAQHQGTPAAHPTTSPHSTNVLLTAYDNTVSQGSAHVTLHETVSTAAASTTSARTVELNGSGVINFASKQEDLALSIPSAGTITMRVISPELYMQLPAQLRTQVSGGKQWVSLNLDKLAEAKLGASLSQLSSSSETPTQTLSYLQAVSDTGLHRVGADNLSGVSTTEYAATVDLSKAAALKDARVRVAIAKMETVLHTSTLPVHVWVDAQQRIRQIGLAFSIPTSAGTNAQLALTMDYSDFGSPVTISAPPSDQVDDITNQTINAATSTTTAAG